MAWTRRPLSFRPLACASRWHIVTALALLGTVALGQITQEKEPTSTQPELPSGSMCFWNDEAALVFEEGGMGKRVHVDDCEGLCCVNRVCQTESTCHNMSVARNLFLTLGFVGCCCCCCCCCYIFNMSLPLGATVIVVGASDQFEALNGAYCPRGEKHNGHEMLLNENEKAQLFWQEGGWNLRMGTEPPLAGCCKALRGGASDGVYRVQFQPGKESIEDTRALVGEEVWKKFKGVPFGEWEFAEDPSCKCLVQELEAYTISGAPKGLRNLNGVYHRVGHHKKRPKYRHDTFNSTIYFEGRWIIFTGGPVALDEAGYPLDNQPIVDDRCCFHFVGDGGPAARATELPPEGFWVKHGESQTSGTKGVKVKRMKLSDTRLQRVAHRTLHSAKLPDGECLTAGTKGGKAGEGLARSGTADANLLGKKLSVTTSYTTATANTTFTAQTNHTNHTAFSGISAGSAKAATHAKVASLKRKMSGQIVTPSEKAGISSLQDAHDIMDAYRPQLETPTADPELGEGRGRDVSSYEVAPFALGARAHLQSEEADVMRPVFSPVPSDPLTPIIPCASRPDMFYK